MSADCRIRLWRRTEVMWHGLALLGMLLVVAGAGDAVPPSGQGPGDTGAELAVVRTRVSHVQTMVAEFIQRRRMEMLEDVLESRGILIFQRPGCVRWETTHPYRSLFVATPEGVAQFEWMQGERRRLDMAHVRVARQVVEQISGIWTGSYLDRTDAYHVSVLGGTGLVVRVVPLDRHIRAAMEMIDVTADRTSGVVTRVVLREPQGDFTELEFSRVVTNAVLPEGTFDLQNPIVLESVMKGLAHGR